MNKTRLFKKSLLAVTIASTAMASQQAMAAGFQLNSQSATGLGRAFAGDAVIADNASVMARNAAAMTLFDSHQFSGGVNYIGTDIDVKDIKYGGVVDLPSENNTSDSFVPNIYYIHKINDQIAIGAGIYSNFGTKNEFSNSFGEGTGDPLTSTPGAGVFGGNTEIQSINYTLNAAYRVNEQWSIGAGLDIVQGSGVLKRSAYTNIPSDVVNIDADGVGIGFNLGTVFELDKDNRFGLAYHYQPEIEAKGDFSGQKTSSADKLYLPLPDMVEFSGYHKITDSKFAVHYSVQWIGWSTFDTLDINTPLGRTELSSYNWQDGWHFALGGTYFLDDHWTLRAGYMYDTAAQDKETSISVPDSDRQWFSAGVGYAFDAHHSVDFGFTYLLGKDVDVIEGNGALTAVTHANAILAGLQYSYSF